MLRANKMTSNLVQILLKHFPDIEASRSLCNVSLQAPTANPSLLLKLQYFVIVHVAIFAQDGLQIQRPDTRPVGFELIEAMNARRVDEALELLGRPVED